jgi:hypothetical protein
MGFLKNLFGIGSNSHEKLSLQDNDLGTFTALNSSENRIIWNGSVEFMVEKVSLFIHGENDKLDDSQKESVMKILKDEPKIELEVDRSLKEQYDNADKEYSNWKVHFKCISISTLENEINITMEEKDSFYHFNIQFKDNKAIDVSIDS